MSDARYDYDLQVWIKDDKYVRCGRIHEGEENRLEDLIPLTDSEQDMWAEAHKK